MNAKLRRPVRALLVTAVVVAAALPAGGGIAGSNRTSAASSTYSDPAGDANGAPDITNVIFSNDDAGVITMRAAVPNRTMLGLEDAVILLIDADRNDATGDGGDDFALIRIAFGVMFERWNGSAWDRFAPPSLVVGWEPAELVFAVDRADLGIADAFDFQLAAVTFAGDDENAWPFDVAPDSGSWTYTLVFAPKAGPARLRPAPPRAGRLFSVAVPVTSAGKPVDRGTVKCTATLGGKRLAAAAKGLNAGTAGCTWRLPATAAGRRISGSVTVTTQGGTATRTFTARVR